MTGSPYSCFCPDALIFSRRYYYAAHDLWLRDYHCNRHGFSWSIRECVL